MEDWFWDDYRMSHPEDYLNDEDKELTKEAEDKLDAIDEEMGELQEAIGRI